MGDENLLPLALDSQSLHAVDGSIPPLEAESTAVIKTKKIIAKKAIVDPRIELTDAELIASRERYDQDQQRKGQELDAKKKDKQAYFSAMEVRVDNSRLIIGDPDKRPADDLGTSLYMCVRFSLFNVLVRTHSFRDVL